jgi:xylulokinase
MADVLERPIRQVDQPIHANTRGAALLAALALKRATLDDIARGVEITQTFTPDTRHGAVYGPLYKEFRAFHKQTKGIYARLNRHG